MAGLIDLGLDYKKQANAGFANVAKARTEAANFNRRLNTQNKAAAYNAAGTGLGLGYQAYNSGMIGKAAEQLGANPDIVNALTPTPEPGTIGGNPAPVDPGAPTGVDATQAAEAVKGVPMPEGSMESLANAATETAPAAETALASEAAPAAEAATAGEAAIAGEVAAGAETAGAGASAAGGSSWLASLLAL